jgi:hypothetical protein
MGSCPSAPSLRKGTRKFKITATATATATAEQQQQQQQGNTLRPVVPMKVEVVFTSRKGRSIVSQRIVISL